MFFSRSNSGDSSPAHSAPLTPTDGDYLSLLPPIDTTTMAASTDENNKAKDLDMLAASFLEELDSFGMPVGGIVNDFVMKDTNYNKDSLDMPLFNVPPSATHPMARAFSLFGARNQPSPVGSPFELPFDDVPPIGTPALIPDTDFDIAVQPTAVAGSGAGFDTSPLWQSISATDIAVSQQWNLFPVTQTPTVSPKELALPLTSFGDALVIPAPADLAVDLSQSRKRSALDFENTDVAIPYSNKRARDSSSTTASTSDASLSAISSATAAFIAAAAPATPAVVSQILGTPATSSASSACGRYTGSRHTSIPLLDESAPIQQRKYHGPPSKTSKRAVPAAAAKRVAALQAQAENTGADTTDAIEDTIANRRLHNTLAARRSRQRKAEHLHILEQRIRELEDAVIRSDAEKQVWMARAMDAGWSDKSRQILQL